MSQVIPAIRQPAAVLGELKIPGLHPAAPGDTEVDGNLGLRNIETPQLVYVKSGNRLRTGQLVELFSGSSFLPVAHTFVMEGDAQREWLPILLPATSIKPQWIDPLVCRVNHTGDSSRPLRLRVDLDRPGGQDPDPTTPGHQGLVIYLPDDVLVKGVNEDRARKGIEITVMPYAHMAQRDCLVLCWGEQQMTYSVTDADLGREINLVVPYEIVMAARDALELHVRLQVRGHTGNSTAPSARWSPVGKVLVSAQRDILQEIFSGEIDPKTGVVDLDKLMGKPLIASLFADPNYFERDDTLTFFFTATDAQGEVFIHSEERPVDKINAIYGFEVRAEFMANLVQGHAKLHYTLRKNIGATTMYSQAVYVGIQGSPVQWAAPYFFDTMPFAEVRPVPLDGYAYVPYQASWKPSDNVTLVWLLADPEGTVEYRSSRSADERPEHGSLEFVLPAAQLKRFEGRPSLMYYEAHGADDRLLGQSAYKTLLLGEPWVPMKAPVVEKVIGHMLDPDHVPDGVWVTLPNPPVKGDVRLHWYGPGGRIEMLVFVAAPGDVRIKVPAKYVLDNLNQVVKVYWVVYQGRTPYRHSSVVTLRIARRGIDGYEDRQ